MVDGCQINSRTQSATGPVPCVVVDLDGTLLQGNSLRRLIRYMAVKLLRERRLWLLAKLCGLAALRRVKAISHVRMKYPIHSMAAGMMDDSELAVFADSLKPLLNTRLFARLDDYRRRGYKLIIATAAPDLYLPQLVAALGFDGFVATALTDDIAAYTETRGERKVALVTACAAARGLEIRAVATDHEDDLPLLGLPAVERLLVSPTVRLRRLAADSGLDFVEL